jgi:hypothetical protein
MLLAEEDKSLVREKTSSLLHWRVLVDVEHKRTSLGDGE